MSRIEDALKKALEYGKAAPEKKSAAIEPAAQPAAAPSPATVVDMTTVNHPYLPTLLEPSCLVSEEFKKMKSSLVKWAKQERFKNMVLITSSIGGEGKSVIAANLAVSLSQDYDHSVLLIDADLRRPTLHSYFGVEPARGLSDCLAEDTDIDTALVSIGSEHLTFLPAGWKKDNPVELFSSKKMQKLIHDIRRRYADRYVIVDGPPVLLFAEAKVLGQLVDGVVFVVKEEMAALQNVSDALTVMKDSNIMGIVYNGISMENFESYCHYRHYGRYAAAAPRS